MKRYFLRVGFGEINSFVGVSKEDFLHVLDEVSTEYTVSNIIDEDGDTVYFYEKDHQSFRLGFVMDN